jgi:DNA polymerase-3 subunit delta'
MPRFADIRGQERAHAILRLAAQRDRLPHAFLFYGERGVGKTTTALALAQFLACESPEAGDSCGGCRSCRQIDGFRHPDLHWIFPLPGSERGQKLKGGKREDALREVMDERVAPGIHGLSYAGAASIAIGRDEDTRAGSIADLRHQAGMSPVEDGLKVFVVSDAERMTREAANSLLKVLEEPPPRNLLILVTPRPGELLDTIVSRCHTVRFADLPRDEIAALLRERGGYARKKGSRKDNPVYVQDPPDEDEAALAAALAQGSLTRAAQLVEEDVVKLRDEALAFLRLRPGDPELHVAVEELDRRMGLGGKDDSGAADRRSVERLVDFGLLWLLDVLRAATGSGIPPANRDREIEIAKLARGLPVAEIRRRVEVLERARAALRGNVYRPLVLYPLLHSLARTPDPVEVG